MKLQPSCNNLDCKLNWLFSDFSVEAVVLTFNLNYWINELTVQGA